MQETEERELARAIKNRPSPMKFRVVWPVVWAAGLVPLTVVFSVIFAIAAVLVAVFEPGVGNLANAAWLMFQVVTTIGLGDFTCVSVVGRISAIVLSVYSVFYLALVTGAVVSFCSERMKHRRNESIAHFLDQLEHLTELSQEELAELSEKVKRLR